MAAPLYFAVVYYHNDAEDVKSVKAEEGWSMLFSLLLGYLLPAYLGSRDSWSNGGITAFLCFPIYLATLNTVLPPILKTVMRGTTARVPIALTTILCMVVSVQGHVRLLWGDNPLKYIYSPLLGVPGPVRDIHLLTLHDYVFATLALASYTVLRIRELAPTYDRRMGVSTLVVLLCTQGDPAALVAWLWGSAELGRAGDDSDDGSSRQGQTNSKQERVRLLNKEAGR